MDLGTNFGTIAKTVGTILLFNPKFENKNIDLNDIYDVDNYK